MNDVYNDLRTLKQAPKDIQELCEYIRNPKGLKYTDKGDLQWAK